MMAFVMTPVLLSILNLASLILASSVRGGLDPTIPIERAEDGFKRGEAVLLVVGVILTICMTVFFIFIIRMANRDSAEQDD